MSTKRKSSDTDDNSVQSTPEMLPTIEIPYPPYNYNNDLISKQGRPSSCSPEIISEICTRIAMGEALPNICQDPHMPPESTVYNWMYAYEPGTAVNTIFLDAFLRACDVRWRREVHNMVALADMANKENAHAIRVRVDTRKWLISKIFPKEYGDHQSLDVSGAVDIRVSAVHKALGAGESRPQIPQDMATDKPTKKR